MSSFAFFEERKVVPDSLQDGIAGPRDQKGWAPLDYCKISWARRGSLRRQGQEQNSTLDPSELDFGFKTLATPLLTLIVKCKSHGIKNIEFSVFLRCHFLNE